MTWTLLSLMGSAEQSVILPKVWEQQSSVCWFVLFVCFLIPAPGHPRRVL